MSKNNSFHAYFTDTSHIPSSSEIRNPVPMDMWSVFGDESCGEAQLAQHVVIDFTPNNDDSVFIQKKVCSFFNFINNHPEIQNLKVKPKKCEFHDIPPSNTNVPIPPRKVVKPLPERNVMDKTAFSMLQIFEEKEIASDALKAIPPHDVCSLEFLKEEEHTQQKKTVKPAVVSACTKPCKRGHLKKRKASKTKQLCTKLEEWDDKHPQSMDPPGHPPSIQHCNIQKQVFKY